MSTHNTFEIPSRLILLRIRNLNPETHIDAGPRSGPPSAYIGGPRGSDLEDPWIGCGAFISSSHVTATKLPAISGHNLVVARPTVYQIAVINAVLGANLDNASLWLLASDNQGHHVCETHSGEAVVEFNKQLARYQRQDDILTLGKEY